jgi:tetratricopeptide (TPR) repeat protein
MNVPQEYWTGYSKVTKYLDAGDKALKDQQYKAAVLNFNTILSDQSLAIFPFYSTAKEKRLDAFDKYFTESYGAFSRSIGSDGDLKQKLAATGESITMFQYVVDSLADQSSGVSASDETIVPLMERAKNAFRRSRLMLDSLHQSLDDFNVRWIIAGSSAGRIDFKYKYMIEALAYAFTSVNFADSTAKDLTVVLPEDLSARLKKYNLMESYETFVRIATLRWKKKSVLLPPDFFTNLAKDSLQFPLPYYSVLKATNDFFNSNYAETKKEIFQVMKKSYDHELTGRMDDLRVIIDTREKKIPGEVLAHMKDGQVAEEKGNADGAAEHYKDAMLISEEYAPAAFALGKLYDRIGDSYKANNFFQKAVTSDTIYYSAYRFLYINYFKNSNFKPMIDLLTQALARGNDFYDIHYYLGIAYNGAALYEEAIKQYERALELNSRSIDANIQAGIAYQNMKSYVKARDYYARAIQIDPENQTATENLKRLDELQKKF